MRWAPFMRLVDGAGGLLDVAHHAAADARRSARSPTPRILAPGSRASPVTSRDQPRRPWWSRGRARRPAAGAGAHAPGPADDHLAGEAPIELLVCPPAAGRASCSTAITARMSSAVTVGAEPEPPPVRPRVPRPSRTRQAAPTRANSAGIALPHPREHPRHHASRRWRPPADRAPTRTGRREAPGPAASSSASRPLALARAPPAPPRPASISSVPGSRRRTSAAHAGHGARPGAGAAEVVEDAGRRAPSSSAAITFAGVKILQSGDFHPSDPEESRGRGAAGRQRRDQQRRARRPQPGRGRRCQPALQAALSHRTSSGPTRVMSPAPSVSTTSPGASSSDTRAADSARSARTACRRRPARAASATWLAAHAGNRLLPRRIDLGDDDQVGRRQRLAHRLPVRRGAGVQVRLEHRHQPPARERPAGPRRAWPRARTDGGRSRPPRPRRRTLPAARTGGPRPRTRPSAAAPRLERRHRAHRRRASAADGVPQVVQAGHLEPKLQRRGRRAMRSAAVGASRPAGPRR